MKVIYEPAGRAREYASLACNLYTGCSHGCLYCYSPAVMRMTPAEFQASPRPRKNVIEQLEADCVRLKRVGNTETPVLFCFTTDPYQPELDEQYHYMRDAIEVLRKNRIPPRILTKNSRARADFDLLAICNQPEFGMTLTLHDEAKSREWEPHASLPHQRFDTLRTAKWNYSIKTWASLEPILDVDETIRCIEATSDYVDLFKVGRWNHDPRADQMNWVEIRRKVVGVLEDLGCNYVLKRDLKVAQ